MPGSGIADDDLDVPAKILGAPERHQRAGTVHFDAGYDDRPRRFVAEPGHRVLAHDHDRAAAADAAEIAEGEGIILHGRLLLGTEIDMPLAASNETHAVGFHPSGHIVEPLDALRAGNIAIDDGWLTQQGICR